MKIAYSNLACPEWSMDEVFTHAAKVGFDGVEIRLLDGNVIPYTIDAGLRQQTMKLASDCGVNEICHS